MHTDSLPLFLRKENRMSSTDSARIPERREEIADNTAISAEPRPLPSSRKPRFTIKVKGMIPT